SASPLGEHPSRYSFRPGPPAWRPCPADGQASRPCNRREGARESGRRGGTLLPDHAGNRRWRRDRPGILGEGRMTLAGTAASPRCFQFLFRVGPITGRESLFSARHDGAPVKTKTPVAVFAAPTARPEGTPLSQPRAERGE